MIYLADTADLAEIRELFEYYPMEGVTTNPTILSKTGSTLSKVIPEIQKLVGKKMLHMQTISEKAEDILAEAKSYRDYFDFNDNFYVKIPVTKEGFKAIRMVKDAGMKVSSTAIFTQQQALVASNAGADFVKTFQMHQCKTRVLDALMRHPMTDKGVMDFERDGSHVYDVPWA